MQYWKLKLVCLCLLALPYSLLGGNLPCSATVLPNNMTDFDYYDNSANTASGVPAPPCGNYVTKDIWFSVQATANGKLYIVTLAGSLTNAAMAVYEGSCANPQLIRCVENDLCGNTEMPITSFDDLVPNGTYLIRIWAEFGGPNGTFGIRISEEDLAPTQFDLTNNATYISEECIQLTANSPSQLGCAWFPEQIDFTQSFTHTMSMNFGGSDAGADGICLVYQSNNNSICGQGGGLIGAGTIPNSFIVEFDTYVNAMPYNDPPFDHSSVNVNGDMDHLNSISAPVSLNGGNIETNQDFDVTFSWDPVGNSYEVYFDGSLIHSGSYDIVNNCFGGNTMAYWGYAASTGGAWNTQTICPGADLYPHGVETMDSVQICDGESYFVGGANQTMSGDYLDIFIAPNGCDSIVHTNLEVLPNAEIDLPLQVICDGDCIFVGGQQFCSSGIFDVLTPANNGCDSTINFELTVLNPIAVAFPPALPLSCNIVAVQIDGSLSTSGPDVIYSWTGPNGFTSTDQSPWVFEGGIYTLVVIQSLGGVDCVSNTFNVEVIEDTAVPVADAGEDVILNCDGNAIFLDGSGSDSGSNISYSWSGPNGFQSNDQNPSISESGQYTLVVVNNANGCFSTDFVDVSGDIILPLAEATGGNINCEVNSTQLTGSSDIADVIFIWTGPNGFESGIQNPVVDEAGIYTLTVFTDAGCVSSDTALVSGSFDQPVLSASGDTITCSDNSGQLSGQSDTPGTEFNWSGPNGYSSNLQNPVVGISGMYTLVGTAPNGCSDTISVEIISDANIPQVQLQNDTLNCTIQMLNLDLQFAGDELVFYWEGPNGFTSNDTTPLIDQAGTYIITVTAANGCEIIDSLSIESDMLAPTIDLNSDTISCLSGSVQILSNISDTTGVISWNGPGGFSSSEPDPVVSQPGIYTCVVISNNGCKDSSSVEIFQDIDVPDLSVSGDTLNCIQDSVIIIASSSDPTVLYEWTGPNGFNSNTSEPVIYFPGIYTISILADNGCIASQDVFVPADTITPVTTLVSDTLNCNNTSVSIQNLSDQSNYVYEWNGPGGFVSGDNEPVISSSGQYFLTITLPNGCETSDQISVATDTISPVIELSVIDTLDCANPLGKISVLSDLTDVLVNWTGPNGFTSTEFEPTITTSGLYSVVATNINGCSSTSFIDIPADTLSPVFQVFDDVIDCNNPSVQLIYQSDGSEISIQWTGPDGYSSQSPDPMITSGGMYTLELTNASGCKAQQTLNIEVDTITPDFDLTGNDINCDEIETDISILNADSQWNFSWSGPQNYSSSEQDITIADPGIYVVSATNPENGCSSAESIQINQIFGPNLVDFLLDQPDCFAPDFGFLEVNNVSGGTEPIQFAIDQQNNYTTSLNFNDLAPGLHQLYLLDANGCQLDTFFTVLAFNALTIDLIDFIQIAFGENYQLIVNTNIPESQIASISWSPSEGLSCTDCLDPYVTGGQITNYVVTLTDINGCEIFAEVDIRILKSEVYAPNIFSPNNDGVNDFFTIFGSQDQIEGIKALHIYDRWGNLVFKNEDMEINNTNEGWDGTFNNRLSITGVYTYYAQIEFKNGELSTIQGDISLIR